ncbi:ABC transporter permease [Jiangella sp. DSM 45060]|uniref:ABC transporter permease n=1 Tax=Jiangella sp. DSM 45060 TaxID=1798224 RepID=UPI00087CE053|nr:ABC transporter permease [Jiangella sp. DSM 45060]SDT72290.1 peptide/nickel transport system permease protein [Jiangella sp. DSM 45060]
MTIPTRSSIRRTRPGPTLRRYASGLRSPRGIAASAIIVLIGAAAALAPVLFPAGYDVQSADSLAGPSLEHPFGTDELGRDLLVRSVFGVRADLTLIVAAVPVSGVVGMILGMLGSISRVLGIAAQHVLDVIVGFPSLILGISIVLLSGPGWTALFVAIVIAGLPGFGRLARAVELSQQSREYVLAARTLGVGRARIIVRHILPSTLDPVIVHAAVFAVTAIFIETGLSIVGLGLQPPEPSLGTLLNAGMRYVYESPSYVVGPMLILLLLALAFTLLADALNETVTTR